MTKKTMIDLALFCASCDIVQLAGEARMSIWDRADFGHAACVTVSAVALPLLSGQDRTGQLPFLLWNRGQVFAVPPAPCQVGSVCTFLDSPWWQTLFSPQRRSPAGHTSACKGSSHHLGSHTPDWKTCPRSLGEHWALGLMEIWPYGCSFGNPPPL